MFVLNYDTQCKKQPTKSRVEHQTTQGIYFKNVYCNVLNPNLFFNLIPQIQIYVYLVSRLNLKREYKHHIQSEKISWIYGEKL